MILEEGKYYKVNTISGELRCIGKAQKADINYGDVFVFICDYYGKKRQVSYINDNSNTGYTNPHVTEELI